ncbi:MAG: XRE family transcriptional regulator [Planctomycetes bacterium]|nr:XRE family transcriptional regulator [Planctomycetota bacterium]
MNDQIRNISSRIRELRDIVGLDAAQVAEKIGVPLEEYQDYEAARADIPISVLYNTAAVLGVDPTELMTGDIPKMIRYSLSRHDQDITIERRENYAFSVLAHNFKDRDMDPMVVYLTRSDDIEVTTHAGQEFNYVLEGEVEVQVGKKRFTLVPGDSIYFDPSVVHGQRALTETAKFLTVINERQAMVH